MAFDPSRIYSSANLQYNGVKTALYGAGGSGKTMTITTCPAPIAVNTEAGMISLRHFNIPIVDISTYYDMVDFWKWVTQSQEAAGYKTIFIDSMTEFIHKVLLEELSKTKDGRQAYQNMQIKINDINRLFKEQTPGKHVVMTYEMERLQNEATGLRLFQPSTPNQTTTRNVEYVFDMLFVMRVFRDKDGKTTRMFQTEEDGEYLAKQHSGLTPLPMFMPADFSQVYSIIEGEPVRNV